MSSALAAPKKIYTKLRALAHDERRFRADHNVAFDPALAPQVARIVPELKARGIAKVEGFWSREKAMALGESLAAECKTRRDDNIQVRTGSIRWNKVELQHPELLAEYGNHPLIKAVSEKYFGRHNVYRLSFQESFADPEVQRMLAERKDSLALAKVGLGRSWHADTWAYALKAFVLLTDVTMDQGPFLHVPGSHRSGFSRLAWIRLKKSWRILPPDDFNNDELYLDAKQAARVSKRTDIVAGIGTAGTLYFADTRGWHRAGDLNSGMRRVIWNYLT